MGNFRFCRVVDFFVPNVKIRLITLCLAKLKLILNIYMSVFQESEYIEI